MENQNRLALVQEEDLSLVDKNVLNKKQLQQLLKRTPPQYIHQRPGKGGQSWNYVTGGYVMKVLNLMFGWDWDFEIVSDTIVQDSVVVKGKLTCRIGERTIVKTQYGRKEIAFMTKTENNVKTKTDKYLDIGNDMKAAATDALKKCAAMIGIAADIYNKEEFKEVGISDEDTPAPVPQLQQPQQPVVVSTDDIDALPFIETPPPVQQPIINTSDTFEL